MQDEESRTLLPPVHQHQWDDGTAFVHAHKRGEIPHGHHGARYISMDPRANVADLGSGYVQYNCQFCGRGPVSARKDSIAGRLRACTVCLRKASASETLKRLKPVNDPAVTAMLKFVEESFAPPE
jgi:hypothetical protein